MYHQCVTLHALPPRGEGGVMCPLSSPSKERGGSPHGGQLGGEGVMCFFPDTTEEGGISCLLLGANEEGAEGGGSYLSTSKTSPGRGVTCPRPGANNDLRVHKIGEINQY
ncbi:hypothetical protein FKM82_028911 [Ascaphus truei]